MVAIVVAHRPRGFGPSFQYTHGIRAIHSTAGEHEHIAWRDSARWIVGIAGCGHAGHRLSTTSAADHYASGIGPDRLPGDLAARSSAEETRGIQPCRSDSSGVETGGAPHRARIACQCLPPQQEQTAVRGTDRRRRCAPYSNPRLKSWIRLRQRTVWTFRNGGNSATSQAALWILNTPVGP